MELIPNPGVKLSVCIGEKRMVTYDQPTYMIVNPDSNWAGESRFDNIVEAAITAKEMTKMGGDTYYVVEIRATSDIDARVMDLYGEVVA